MGTWGPLVQEMAGTQEKGERRGWDSVQDVVQLRQQLGLHLQATAMQGSNMITRFLERQSWQRSR